MFGSFSSSWLKTSLQDSPRLTFLPVFSSSSFFLDVVMFSSHKSTKWWADLQAWPTMEGERVERAGQPGLCSPGQPQALCGYRAQTFSSKVWAPAYIPGGPSRQKTHKLKCDTLPLYGLGFRFLPSSWKGKSAPWEGLTWHMFHPSFSDFGQSS